MALVLLFIYYIIKTMIGFDYNRLKDLSPLDEIRQTPPSCEKCGIALAALRSAIGLRSIAKFAYEIAVKRPAENEMRERLDDDPDFAESIREFLFESGEFEEEDIETTEQLMNALSRISGKVANLMIETSNNATRKYTELIEVCNDNGPDSTIIPRENQRPAKITFCSGTVNLASHDKPIRTKVIVEEVD